jgi:WD40 repeat protein
VGFDVTAGASSIWHVDTGRVVPLPTGESLEYSHSSINEMTKATGPDYKLSPDARKFLYRNSHMFRVWDAETGVILAGATGSGGFRQCTVSPDWSKILTIDMEDNLRIWHITTDSPDDTARRRLELEVRSATTLHADGSLSILPEAEWEQKRRQWQDLPKRPGN